jgi:branched-chain amino acid transport system ATP-binding protein
MTAKLGNQPGQNLLELKQVNAFYGELQILRDVSLQVEQGRLTLILGSNGAGKTTLLKTISGLTFMKSGSITFEGAELSNIKPYHIPTLGIAHVPEGRGIFPDLTVLENIELGAYAKNARHKLKNNLEWCFELFPVLKDRRRQVAATMSGGEQQMIAIARGLLSDPKLLILDEPSIGLMPRLVEEVFEAVQKINREGVTILMVEQNAQESLEICDLCYVLESGRIVHKGTKEDFLDNELLKSAYLGM